MKSVEQIKLINETINKTKQNDKRNDQPYDDQKKIKRTNHIKR